ncbi:MAG: TIM barrel protein [bacterium]|nr:TIM barrel protein [bacterium]
MRVGAAPVSFGVYGPPEAGSGLSPDRLVAAMASSGYDGAEFPPAGYAGSPGSAARLFQRRGLVPVGIYIPLHFADPALLARDEARMEEALCELQETGVGPRLAILADEGSDILLRNPARGDDPTHALSPDAFRELCATANRMAAEIRRRGLVPSFHPHISTYVESPSEVERLLELTDIDLTFDTGHIALGGGDILECLAAWRERINHIHLKDVRLSVLEEAKARGRDDFDVWWADVSVPLGEGDLPLREFLAHLSQSGYRGWAVVEQDRAPISSEAELRSAAGVQARNLQWLRQLEDGSSGKP